MAKERPSWFPRSDALHRKIVAQSKHGYEPYSDYDGRQLALALAGEAGEVAQEFYKAVRDNRTQAEFMARLRAELSDVRIYLELLSEYAGADADRDTEAKLDEVEDRWKDRLG